MQAAVEEYFSYLRAERDASEHTLRNYRSDLAQFLAYLRGHAQGGEVPTPGGVDHFSLRGFLAHLHGKGLAKSSVARKLAVLRSFFRFLCREGALAANPADLLRGVKLSIRTTPHLSVDETFQLLLTFAVVLMLEDIIKIIWGTSPQSTAGVYLAYGQVDLFGAIIPVYNLVVIASSLIIAGLIGYMLTKTKFGRIIRAAAENREVSEALGINMKLVYVKVFTLGTVLGTLGGALVIPASAAMTEMGVELIVMAFAVVVIGGLGSIKGALFGALIVGILRSIAISTYPELELLLIYLIVIGVLIFKPEGLFGGSRA